MALRSLGLIAVAALLVGLLARSIGLVESIALVGGAAATAGTAWLPIRVVRILAPVLLGALLFGLTRTTLTTPGAACLGTLAVAVGITKASPPVLRRIMFIIPSLGLLTFVTTLLMYHAPGNPFAGERIATPQVEAALRAQYGVPKSALDFFQIYIQRLLLEGSFGPSLKVQGRMVGELLEPAFPVDPLAGRILMSAQW